MDEYDIELHRRLRKEQGCDPIIMSPFGTHYGREITSFMVSREPSSGALWGLVFMLEVHD